MKNMLNDLSKQVYNDAKEKGFYKELNVKKELANIKQEVIEAQKAYVDITTVDGVEKFFLELADIVIYTLSLAGAMDVSIGDWIDKKIKINKEREYLHGKF